MHSYEILKGLPPYGPPAEPFPGKRGMHSEGFVVRFNSDNGESWVGNFQPGSGGCDSVFEHPDQAHFLVISGGTGYVINPLTRGCSGRFGGSINTVFAIPELNILVFGDGIRFEAIGPKGRVWLSNRVSWDGMRDLSVDGLVLRGAAWDISDQWIPFELDLLDGKFVGGSYSVLSCELGDSMKPPRIMPPVYLLFAILAMLALGWWVPFRNGFLGPWRWAGLVPIGIGLGLGTWVAMLFSRRHTTIKPGEVSTSLLIAGPFRFSRNPIYLGMVFVLIGIAIALDSLMPWFVVPVFVALISLNVIPVEESMLAEAFGDEYATYRQRVRRWL